MRRRFGRLCCLALTACERAGDEQKALRMDVIDRVTRKKFGCCSLSLLVQDGAGVSGVRAEERLATLRKENALCEIVSTEPGEEDVVLGETWIRHGRCESYIDDVCLVSSQAIWPSTSTLSGLKTCLEMVRTL
jgi:hypothetical protein